MDKGISLILIAFFWLALACNSISNLAVQEERNPLLEGEFGSRASTRMAALILV